MDRDTLNWILGIASSAAVGFFITHALFAYEPRPTRSMLLMFLMAVVVATAVLHIVHDARSERIANIALFLALGGLVRTTLQFFA